MPSIKLEQFGGMLPAWSGHLLPLGQASFAENGYLFSGSTIGWRKPKQLRSLVNSAARMVYRVPVVSETQAIAYLLFVSNPNPGDTVTIGDLTYTFVASLSQPFDVLVDVDTSLTARNLSHAITADSGENTNAGIQYGENTPLNGDVKYYSPDSSVQPGLTDPQVGIATIGSTDYTTLVIGALDFGAAYNLLAVSESTGGTRMKWLYDTLALAHTTTTFLGGTNPSFDESITGDAAWLEFNDPDTNVFRSPVAEDQWNRHYWASPSQMPEYNTYGRIRNGDPPWLLGVPPPGCAPILEVTGGGNGLTLGNYTAASTNVTGQSNYVYVMKIRTPGATVIQDVKFTVPTGAPTPDGGWPEAHFAAVVYTDKNGKPDTLVNTGQIATGVSSDAPNQSVFLNPPGLEGDTDFWIGFMIDTAVYFRGGPADPANNTTKWSETFTNGPPAVAPISSPDFQEDTPGLNMWGDFITSDVVESRSYVYTWVTEYGEEGPPSPPTLLDGWSNGTWTIGLWQPPPNDLGILRNVKKIRIYRTVTGQGGTTVFFFVDEVEVGTTGFIDTKPDSEVALNDQMQSTNWFPPPANLQGFTVMQNGMVAGFVGNSVWFCEPYHPHAWPPGYVMTVDFPIVGLGTTNGALVVCTSAMPYVLSGNSPAGMSQTKCSVSDPCLSRASILSGDAAVTYMSPNGLIQITATGGATNTTDLWFTREKWRELTPQQFTRAIFLASSYYCLGSVSPDGLDTSEAQRGFTIELAADAASFSIWPQPGGHRVGFQVLDSPIDDTDVQNVLTDPYTGIGLVIADGKVWYFDFSDTEPDLKVYTWKSKLYQQNVKRSYAAMKVYYDVPPGTAAQNDTVIEEVASAAIWAADLPADRYGYIKTYVDTDGTGAMLLIDCREIRKSGGLLRIVDGFKAETWQWEVVSRVKISNIQVATSVKELAQT